MSQKRRDSKNRILQLRESQRPDGRYQYKYTDAIGAPRFTYSWKLVPTDKIPAGKRPDISLREKIRQLQEDLDDVIDTLGKKMTVCQLYAKYIRQRNNVKRGTKNSRKQLMVLLSKDKLGVTAIENVKLSHARVGFAYAGKWTGLSFHTKL